MYLKSMRKALFCYSIRAIIFLFLFCCNETKLPILILLQINDVCVQILRSPWTLYQLYSDSYQFMWTLILLVCTFLYIRSGFIALLWIVFSSTESILYTRIFRHWIGKHSIFKSQWERERESMRVCMRICMFF